MNRDVEEFLDNPEPPLVIGTLLTMMEELRQLLLKQQVEIQSLRQLVTSQWQQPYSQGWSDANGPLWTNQLGNSTKLLYDPDTAKYVFNATVTTEA